MSSVRFTNINGHDYDWGSIIFSFMGRTPAGVTSITYDLDAPKVAQYGTGVSNTGHGVGNEVFTGSISLLQSEVQKLKNISPNGRITDLPPFSIKIIYKPEPTKVVTDILKGVMFNKMGVATTQGDTEIVADIELYISDITFGKSPA